MAVAVTPGYFRGTEELNTTPTLETTMERSLSRSSRLRENLRKLLFRKSFSPTPVHQPECMDSQPSSGSTEPQTTASFSQPSCTPCLTELPAELFIHVISFLSAADCWRLAFTSKTLYTMTKDLHKMSPIASLEERYDFLVILERDYPEYIACVHETYVKPRIWKKEVVFHPWRDSNVTATPCGPLDQAGCYRATGSAVNGLHYHHPWTPNAPLPPRWFVSEEVRRLVLRGELLGRKYGYGISILKQDFYGHADAESSWSTNITPKITSKGNLVIRRQTMFRTRIFDRSLPYRKPNAEQLRQCICRHVTGVLAMALFRNMVDRLYRYQDIRALDPYNWRFSVNADRCDNYPRGWVSHPKLLKCQFCATDIYCRAKLLARDQSLAMTDDEILPTMEAEYYAVVEFDVYHDLGGLYTPLSLAQKKTVRDIARTVTSEEEALERLREDLKIRWSGRQVEWSLHFPTSVKNVKSSNYTAEGICSSAGIPIDVCFLRSDGLPLNNPAIREAWFSTPGDVSSSGGDWRHGFP